MSGRMLFMKSARPRGVGSLLCRLARKLWVCDRMASWRSRSAADSNRTMGSRASLRSCRAAATSRSVAATCPAAADPGAHQTRARQERGCEPRPSGHYIGSVDARRRHEHLAVPVYFHRTQGIANDDGCGLQASAHASARRGVSAAELLAELGQRAHYSYPTLPLGRRLLGGAAEALRWRRSLPAAVLPGARSWRHRRGLGQGAAEPRLTGRGTGRVAQASAKQPATPSR